MPTSHVVGEIPARKLHVVIEPRSEYHRLLCRGRLPHVDAGTSGRAFRKPDPGVLEAKSVGSYESTWYSHYGVLPILSLERVPGFARIGSNKEGSLVITVMTHPHSSI